MSRIIIAIDGHSGCGKSSTARAVARELGYTYVDSGAMYRAVTLYFLDHEVDPADAVAVAQALADIRIEFRRGTDGRSETWLNGENCETRIRDMRIAREVSRFSAIPAVRRSMVERQRAMGRDRGIVMDGRDIGTVVYPDAELKIFLTASLDVRAQRRKLELETQGLVADVEEIRSNLALRDEADSNRTESPLRKASDAIEIDTSDLLFKAQVEQVIGLARVRTNAR